MNGPCYSGDVAAAINAVAVILWTLAGLLALAGLAFWNASRIVRDNGTESTGMP